MAEAQRREADFQGIPVVGQVCSLLQIEGRFAVNRTGENGAGRGGTDKTGPATYVNAEAACSAFGSKLAVIKNAATNATVRSLIGLTDAFVGGTDSAAEGSWIWLRNPLDTIVVGVAYTNWRSGEPNNGSTNPEGEDCMIIEGDQNGTWDDRPCAPPPLGAGAYAYVCEF